LQRKYCAHFIRTIIILYYNRLLELNAMIAKYNIDRRHVETHNICLFITENNIRPAILLYYVRVGHGRDFRVKVIRTNRTNLSEIMMEN